MKGFRVQVIDAPPWVVEVAIQHDDNTYTQFELTVPECSMLSTILHHSAETLKFMEATQGTQGDGDDQ